MDQDEMRLNFGSMKYLLQLPIIWTFAAALLGQVPKQPADALRAGFQQPPQNAKLRCYWWWLNGNTTAETITRDLEEMKSHGYAGAILVDADGSGQQDNTEVQTGPAIGSPEWTTLLVHALDVAQKLGLEISLTITSRWDVGIIGGATVTPEDALKRLTFSRTTVEGGGTRAVKLPVPQIDNGFYRPIATLVYPLRHGTALPGGQGSDRVMIPDLIFKTASIETGFSMPSSNEVLRIAPSTAGEEDAEVNDVLDVSSHVDEAGTLHCELPSGTWEVLRIGYTDTRKHLSDGGGTPLGLPLDALNAQAFDRYWERAVVPLLDAASPYIGKSLRYLVTDSWEAGGANWTDGFREEFQRRRGYDPLPLLPIVAGRILTSRDTSDRFLFDLRRTVADLITTNYYDRFAEHARERGLETHPESGGPHGAPIDALETFRSAAFPQTEFWAVSGTHRVADQERFFVKEASSAAHIYGKRFVAAEGLTSMNPAAWSESLSDNLQPTFDRALTEGLNRLYWHEFTSSPAKYGLPGQEYFAGTHLNPNVTWWNQAGPLLLAFNRAQYLMQQGDSVSDLLYLYGDQVPGFVRVKNDDPAHVLPGYDYDVTDEDALLHRMKFSGADLYTPEGLHYAALTLPASRSLSFAALTWVSKFVHQGGVVIGLKPTGPLGILSTQRQLDYTQLVDELWRGCEDSDARISRYGEGRIYCTANTRAVFAVMNKAPDFSYVLSGDVATARDVGPVFDYVHRKTPDVDIYFVRNTLNSSVEATLSFRVAGRVPEIWSTDDGSAVPALIYRETKDGRTEIPLTFPALGSTFVVFEHQLARHLTSMSSDGKGVFPSICRGDDVFPSDESTFIATHAGKYLTIDTEGRQSTFVVRKEDAPAPMFGPWTLSFPAGWGAPSSVPVEHFGSWTDSEVSEIRYFSGTATYHANLHLSAEIARSQQVWLDLGQVREISNVIVNGTLIETMWRAPFKTRIDLLLHPGENTIEIQVTNLWPNRIIGDLQPSATTHYTHTNIHAYSKDSPLIPSGLLTPIAVEIYTLQHVQ